MRWFQREIHSGECCRGRVRLGIAGQLGSHSLCELWVSSTISLRTVILRGLMRLCQKELQTVLPERVALEARGPASGEGPAWLCFGT